MVIQIIINEFEYNARCTHYKILIIIIKLHKSTKLVITSYLIQTTPCCAPDSAIFDTIQAHHPTSYSVLTQVSLGVVLREMGPWRFMSVSPQQRQQKSNNMND